VKRLFLVFVLGLLCAGALTLKYGQTLAYDLTRPDVKRGSPAVEFSPQEKRARGSARDHRLTPWPTYGFDVSRTKSAAGLRHRPPYREVWRIDAHDSLEFPPAVGYGKVFLAQQKGLFFALHDRTGKVAWKKRFGRCSASSPTLANGVVYQSWMGDIPCKQWRTGQDGFLVAWRARDGKQLWRFDARPIESSPLYRRGVVYVASWDHYLYAIDARTGALRWSFRADDQPNSTPAYYKGRIYIGTNSGSLYAVNARTGRVAWRAQSHSHLGHRDEFYASPTVAYGRVYIGNVDGTFHAYGAKTGRLLWQRPLGTYIYGSAAVSAGRVFIGTYDGWLFALDAATGDVIWRHASPAAVHSSPVVLDGLVYFASCSSCGRSALRKVKHGHDGTYALDVRSGREVWRFPAGKYASPVVADRDRVYLVGRAKLFALTGRR
jgi:outer membrane protein assembly factor BamB